MRSNNNEINETNEIRNLLRPVFFSIIGALLASVFASASSIGLMGLSALLIASASLQPPLYTLSLAILGVRCCGIMRAVLRYADRYMTHAAGFALFSRFRVQVLCRVIDALPFRRQSTSGDVFDTIAEAVDSLRDSVLRFALAPITASLLAWTAALWLSFYDAYLSLLMMAYWCVFAIAGPFVAWRLYRKYSIPSLKLTQDVIDFYEGSGEASFYGYTVQQLSKAHISINQYQKQRQAVFRLKSRINAASEICTGLFLAASIALLIYSTQKGLNAVTAICIMLTMQAVFELLMALPSLVEHLAEAQKSWHKLQPFYRAAAAAKNTDSFGMDSNILHDKNTVFEAVNLSFGYGDKLICRDLNFGLKKGRKTLLLGASGCGKSTLLYAMMRLLPLQGGSMFLQGRPYNSLSDEEVRSRFAVSFQEHHIFNLSVRGNFKMLYPDIKDAEIISALNRVNLSELASEDMLDFSLNSDGSNLSGGQRHRLQLAICTARSKDVILLDEPTAGLDINSARIFLDSIMAGADANGTAVLVTSHDLSIVDYFDDVIIMQNGRIAEQGSIKNLLKDKNSLLFNHLAYDNLL